MVEEEVKLYLDISDGKMTLAHAKKFVGKQDGIEEWKDYSATAIKGAHGKYNNTSKKVYDFFKKRFTKKNKNMKVGLRLKTATNGNEVKLHSAMFCGPDEKWRSFSENAVKNADGKYNGLFKKGIRSAKRAPGKVMSSVTNLL